MTRTLLLVPILILVWVLLTGGAPTSWMVGIPAVALAAVLGDRLRPQAAPRLRLLEGVAFLAFFAFHSLRGGWDVARRALHPALPLAPGRIRYPCRLPRGTARTFFINTASLLPGTLSADIRDGIIQVHALDADPTVVAGLVGLEQRVARLFGETLAGAPQVTVTSCEREDALALARAEAAAVAQAQTRVEGGDA